MDPWRDIAQLSPSQIRELQSRKLHAFINQYVYPFSPHYRKLFDDKGIDPRSIRTVDDLKRLPFSSKKDFLAPDKGESTFQEFVLKPDEDRIKAAWPKTKMAGLALQRLIKGEAFVLDKLAREFRPVFVTYTTGTTDQPVPFLYTNYDIENLKISGARMVNLFEVGPDEKIINLFPYAPHLAFWQVCFGGMAANVLALSTGGGKVMGTSGNIKAIMKMRPSVVMGVPSYVYHLFRSAQEQGLEMDFVRKVVLGASKVSIDFKKKLAEVLAALGAKEVAIFGTYGFTEARAAWAESPSPIDGSSGYHLYPDKEIVEIIDPKTGEVKGEGGDGEIVYTGLDARGSVVLRYRTGDFVKGGVTTEPSPHSRLSVPRLSNRISRLSDIHDLRLSKVKGALINLGHFADIFSQIGGLEEWQVELRKRNDDPYDMDELVVYAAVKSGRDRDRLKQEIADKMLSTTEVSPNEIRIIELKELVKRLEIETANKEKRILDNRPKE